MAEFKKVVDIKDALTGGTADLRKYTHQIWLAGLGAFTKGEEEGGNFFENLVEMGEAIESKTREKAAPKVTEVRERVKARKDETIEKMEKAFDDRLNGALSRLGLVNKGDMSALQDQIATLAEAVQGLSTAKTEVKAPAKKKSSAKAAAKTATKSADQ